jgi:hypothetical protein
MPIRYWALIIMLGAIWGCSFLFNAVLIREISPLWERRALEVPPCQAEEQRGDRGGQKQHAEDDGGRQVEPVGIGRRGRTQARRVRLFRGGGSDAGYSVLPSKTNPAQVDAGFLILAEAALFTSPAGRAAAPAS